MAQDPQKEDVWLPRLRLAFEFSITVMALFGAYLIAISQATSNEADSGAAAVATLVIGYWFGRSRS